MPRIDLVVTDLDGTLWAGSGPAHARTLAALAALAASGMPVLAATARRPAGARNVMVEHGVLLPAVVFDGALGRNMRTGTTFHRAPLPQPDCLAVLDVLLAHGLQPCLSIDAPDRDFVVGDRPSTHPGHLAYNAALTMRTDDLAAAVRSHDVLSIVLCGQDRDRVDAVARACAPHAEAVVTADRLYGGHSISIRRRGVTKWTGVLAYCEREGIDPAHVLAVGDGENDVELLREAAVACVPADGCEQALALATHVIPRAVDGGWAEILSHLDGPAVVPDGRASRGGGPPAPG